MPRSIDGINRQRVSHDIYIAKRRLDSNRGSFISVQNRSTPRIDTVLNDIDLSLKKPPEKELVINVSRRFSIRASVSIIFQYVLIAAIALAAAYSTAIGQWFVLALAAYVFITRQDSRLTYGIALFVLITVPLFQLINQPGVANNMSIYVFELLILGTIQSLFEIRTLKTKHKSL